MNLSHYSVGGLRVNYTLDAKEKAQLFNMQRAKFTKILFDCFTDDCSLALGTPWGPDAQIEVKVTKFDKDGITVVKKPRIIITPLPGRDEIPLQATIGEWEVMVLERMATSCLTTYKQKTSLEISQEAIEKIKTLETPRPTETNVSFTDAILTGSCLTRQNIALEAAQAFISNASATISSLNAGMMIIPPGWMERPTPHHNPSPAIDVCAPTFNAIMDKPFDVTLDIYGKKTIRTKQEDLEDLSLVPTDDKVDEQPLAANPSLLKRITSLFTRK